VEVLAGLFVRLVKPVATASAGEETDTYCAAVEWNLVWARANCWLRVRFRESGSPRAHVVRSRAVILARTCTLKSGDTPAFLRSLRAFRSSDHT